MNPAGPETNASESNNLDSTGTMEDGSIEAVSPETYAGWVELVSRIRSGESDGMEELYDLFSKGIRFYLCRQLGPQELDDKVHDTFVCRIDYESYCPSCQRASLARRIEARKVYQAAREDDKAGALGDGSRLITARRDTGHAPARSHYRDSSGPKRAPCPTWGCRGRRKRILHRRVRTLAD